MKVLDQISGSVYSGITDGTAVVTMPYVSMDITDKESV